MNGLSKKNKARYSMNFYSRASSASFQLMSALKIPVAAPVLSLN
jgi:hypothetical protein